MFINFVWPFWITETFKMHLKGQCNNKSTHFGRHICADQLNIRTSPPQNPRERLAGTLLRGGGGGGGSSWEACWYPSAGRGGGREVRALVASAHCSQLCSVGPFSRLVIVRLAGAVCACWGFDGSPVRCSGERPIVATRLVPTRWTFGFSGDHQQNIKCVLI